MLCLVNILHQQQHPGKAIYAGKASLLLKGPLEGLLFKTRLFKDSLFSPALFSISKRTNAAFSS